MPNPVPAAAEGLPEINRRRLLGGIVAASTASAVAGGSVALAATEAAVHPLKRLHALHEEASQLMAVHNEYMGGSWELRVRAPDDPSPVAYMNLTAKAAMTPRELRQALEGAYASAAQAGRNRITVKDLSRSPNQFLRTTIGFLQ